MFLSFQLPGACVFLFMHEVGVPDPCFQVVGGMGKVVACRNQRGNALTVATTQSASVCSHVELFYLA